jgi:hypothetical protein
MYQHWFLAAVCVGSASYSAYVIFMLYTDLWTPKCSRIDADLEYISTRLAHCLDRRSTDVWGLVFCVEVQVLLLASVWRRLFASYHIVTRLRECVISCAMWFILSLAMVVEFRNDRNTLTVPFLVFPSVQESILHAYAAVCTMISFTLMHACMCFSLFALQRHEHVLQRSVVHSTTTYQRAGGYISIDFDFRRSVDVLCVDVLSEQRPHVPGLGGTHDTTTTAVDVSSRWNAYRCALCEYAVLDWIYLLGVIVFFFTWALGSSDGPVYDTAVHTEWFVLAMGSFMHMYALRQNWRPLSWVREEPGDILHEACRNLRSCQYTCRSLLLCSSYVCALLYSLVIFGMAPLQLLDAQAPGADQHATSSWQLLAVVVSTYLYAAIILLS